MKRLVLWPRKSASPLHFIVTHSDSHNHARRLHNLHLLCREKMYIFVIGQHCLSFLKMNSFMTGYGCTRIISGRRKHHQLHTTTCVIPVEGCPGTGRWCSPSRPPSSYSCPRMATRHTLHRSHSQGVFRCIVFTFVRY
jgi:hypothetical protein